MASQVIIRRAPQRRAARAIRWEILFATLAAWTLGMFTSCLHFDLFEVASTSVDEYREGYRAAITRDLRCAREF